MERKTAVIRKAVREDAPLILEFIKGIARYEKMENDVEATEETLEEQLFDKERAEVIFAMENGKEVGFALFFQNFSTYSILESTLLPRSIMIGL